MLKKTLPVKPAMYRKKTTELALLKREKVKLTPSKGGSMRRGGAIMEYKINIKIRN